MAGIDKTYTSSWEEYSQLKEWISKHDKTYKDRSYIDGYISVSGCLYDWEESDFDGRELPIMNTPTKIDKYLIRNCPLQFVQDRMKEVYSEKSYKILKGRGRHTFPAKENECYLCRTVFRRHCELFRDAISRMWGLLSPHSNKGREIK